MSDAPIGAGEEDYPPTPSQQTPSSKSGEAEAAQPNGVNSTSKQQRADQLVGGETNLSTESQHDESHQPTAVVRYGLLRQIGEFSHDLDPAPVPGKKVVIRTSRGVELGEVLTVVTDQCRTGCISSQRLYEFIKSSGPDYPFSRDGEILRFANSQDIIDHRHLVSSAREEMVFCRQLIKEIALEMKIVAVEHLLGGERIVFYFAADSRIDFRELVRRLASQYRTRIEMRQVGARDEARLLGDFEKCGRPCCCLEFLKNLKPISMRMAKTQKATLDPSKISGRCGRLMCCLRYEDAEYEELRKLLPNRNTWIRTKDLTGCVLETHILTQLVRIELLDKTQKVIANDEIVERSKEPFPMPAEQAQVVTQRPARQQAVPEQATTSQAQGQEQAQTPAATAEKPRKKRRRRKRTGKKGRGKDKKDGGIAKRADNRRGKPQA